MTACQRAIRRFSGAESGWRAAYRRVRGRGGEFKSAAAATARGAGYFCLAMI